MVVHSRDPLAQVSRLYSSPMTTVNAARLHARIASLARFGALPGGGVTRPCWSPPYEEARAWLLGEIRAAGLSAWVDPAGNVFGGLGASSFSAAAPAVLTGSHIDTVPEGGILDGALGVLAGLECLHAMARAGLDAARAPAAAAPAGAVHAYVELHIEQGPRLDEAGVPIAAVDSIVGVRRTRLIFTGQADHAGTTPMERRRDGFLAAADYSLRARDLVVERGGGRSVTNIGVVFVHPGASNIVPGRAEIVHEMRSPDDDTLEHLARACEGLAQKIGRERGIG